MTPEWRDPRFRELDFLVALERFGEVRERRYRTRRKRYLRKTTAPKGGNRKLRAGTGWRSARAAYLTETGRTGRLALEEARAIGMGEAL